jgi:hypothetical protein
VHKDIDDTHRALHEAAARFLNGLERDDLDILHQTMTDAAASLREVLGRIAAECGLSYDEMCVIAMMAVSSMAEDALPGTRNRLASYAALIDLQDASHC